MKIYKNGKNIVKYNYGEKFMKVSFVFFIYDYTEPLLQKQKKVKTIQKSQKPLKQISVLYVMIHSLHNVPLIMTDVPMIITEIKTE